MRVRRPRMIRSVGNKHQQYALFPTKTESISNTELESNVIISETQKTVNFIVSTVNEVGMQTKEEDNTNNNNEEATNAAGSGSLDEDLYSTENQSEGNTSIITSEENDKRRIGPNWLYIHPILESYDRIHTFINEGNRLAEYPALIIEDTKYVIKGVNKTELAFLMKNMRAMERYWEFIRETYIPRILGVYSNRIEIVIVIEEPFSSAYDQIFDISSMTSNPTLPVENRDKLLRTLERDVDFLASLGVVGYSLRAAVKRDKETRFGIADFLTEGKPKAWWMCCFRGEAEEYSMKFLNTVDGALGYVMI